jgi:hypothetical protein
VTGRRRWWHAGNERKTDSIFVAAELGRCEKIKDFKSKTKHFDINATDSVGRTALMWAADCGQLVRRVTFSPALFPLLVTAENRLCTPSVCAPSTHDADRLNGGEVERDRDTESSLRRELVSCGVRNRPQAGQPRQRRS